MSLFFANRRRMRRWMFFGVIVCMSVSAAAWTGYSYWKWNRVGQIPDIGDPFDVEAWLP
jgi:hypothetical protein